VLKPRALPEPGEDADEPEQEQAEGQDGEQDAARHEQERDCKKTEASLSS
jgi:hypothetical protein